MPPPRHLFQIAVAALTAGAILAGCDNVPAEPTVSKQEAVTRVEARAQDAFGQLPAGATLKLRSSRPDLPCEEGSGGRRFVENSYTIDYPKGWPIEQSLTVLAGYWDRSNYKVVLDLRREEKVPELVVEHPDDLFHIGYLLSYRDNGRVDSVIRSSSTCF